MRLTTKTAVLGLVLGLVGALVTGSAGAAHGAPPASATGTYAYTQITSFTSQEVGGKTVIDQTASGTFSGTLTGTFEDEVTVEILPNGLAKSRGTMTCSCTVAGRSGTLELVHVTAGQFEEQTFDGRATIRRATGDLSGLRGTLDVQGVLDESKKATVTYAGELHSRP